MNILKLTSEQQTQVREEVISSFGDWYNVKEQENEPFFICDFDTSLGTFSLWVENDFSDWGFNTPV